MIDTNWRETRIYDRYSNIIVLPNNNVASQKITNFSNPDRKTALTFPVKVSYEASPSVVFEALCEAASDVSDVLNSPAPEAYVLSYDDFGISYLLKFWIADFSRKYPIMGEVGRKVWCKFKRQNIEVPISISDKVTQVIRSVKEKEGALVIEKEKKRDFRDLINSSFLRYQEGDKVGEFLLPEEEIQELASSIRRQRFAPGEIVFKQGEKGESCYIVA